MRRQRSLLAWVRLGCTCTCVYNTYIQMHIGISAKIQFCVKLPEQAKHQIPFFQTCRLNCAKNKSRKAQGAPRWVWCPPALGSVPHGLCWGPLVCFRQQEATGICISNGTHFLLRVPPQSCALMSVFIPASCSLLLDIKSSSHQHLTAFVETNRRGNLGMI